MSFEDDRVKILDKDQLIEDDTFDDEDFVHEDVKDLDNDDRQSDDVERRNSGSIATYQESIEDFNLIKTSSLRWYILLVFSMLGVWQGMIWNSMGPISNSLLAVFCPDWNKQTLALFGNWGNIMYLIPLFPVLWFLETKGLRKAMVFTGLLMFLGVVVRCLPLSTYAFTWMCHICAILNGIAGIVVFSAPSAVSSAWFPPRERTTATGIALVFNNLGNAASFLMAPAIVPDPSNITNLINFTCPVLPLDEIRFIKNRIALLMYAEAALVTVTFVAILIYFPSKPKYAPSNSAQLDRIDFLPAVRQIVTNKKAVLLCLAYSLFNGVIASWFSVMNITFSNLPFGGPKNKDTIIGHIGLLSIIGNCVTSILVARIVDKLKGKMKLTLSIIMFFGTICWIWMCLICLQKIPFSLPQLYISTILASSLTYSASPIFFEFSVEIAYPVPEGVVGGFLTLVYNTFGMTFLFLFYVPALENNPDWIPYAIMVSTITSLPLLAFVKEEYNRAIHDQTISETTTPTSSPTVPTSTSPEPNPDLDMTDDAFYQSTT